MHLEDLREQLQAIADEAPPSSRDARSVIGPAVRRLWTRRIVASVVTLAVVSGAVVTLAHDQHRARRLSIAGSGPAGSGPTGARPPLSAATIANGRWSAIARSPLATRSGESVIWTGSLMIVWGGREAEHVLGAGAAYDPDTNSWRALPPAPISARSEAAAVWTGREMIVWGGTRALGVNLASDGAAFDPVAWKWRRIAASPLAPRYSATMVWTGTEAIVVGGYETNTGELTSALDAAAYDPATDRWRPIAPLPGVGGAAIKNLSLVWTGNQLLVWELWSRTTNTLRSFGLQLVEYAPSTDEWQRGPEPDDPHRNVYAPIWTGQKVIATAQPPLCDLPNGAENCGPPPTNLHGSEFDPATGKWSAISHGPVDDGAAASVWTGADLVVMSGGTVNPANGAVIEQPGSVAAWNPRTNEWTRLPRPLFADTPGTMLWTGHDILVWNSGRGMRYGLASTERSPTSTAESTTTTAARPIAAALPAVSEMSQLKPAASAVFPRGSSVDSIGVSQPTGCCSETTGPAVAGIDDAGNVEVFDQVNWRIVRRESGHPSARALDAPREGLDASAFDASSPPRAFGIASTDKIMFIRAERVLPDKSLVAVRAYSLGDTSLVDTPDTLVLVRIRPDGSTQVAKFLASAGYMSITGPVVVADDDGVSVLSSTTTAGVEVGRYRYRDLPA